MHVERFINMLHIEAKNFDFTITIPENERTLFRPDDLKKKKKGNDC